MTKAWDDKLDDKLAEFQELRFRAQHDPEYLTRLRSREGDSFSPEEPCNSSSDTLDSSDSSSPDALRWEWCGGPPSQPGQTRMPPPSSKPIPGRWQRMLKRFGKLVLP